MDPEAVRHRGYAIAHLAHLPAAGAFMSSSNRVPNVTDPALPN
jgi:hypothetical protein